MEILASVIDYVLNDLGSTVTLSAVMFVLGLVMGMKPAKAFSAGVMFGVGFSAMSLVIGYMTSAISPAAEAMTKSVGKSFNVVDGGWPTLALITWTWRWAFVLFPVQFGINLVMFVTGRTKTINVDLWNVWGKIFMAI
ncbi:MAG: PTS transporter subunit IIC, partial [Atopobiaceae bacterium]|nr:PTS transporter subunit IIC [Atopobiaceae bacterium]